VAQGVLVLLQQVLQACKLPTVSNGYPSPKASIHTLKHVCAHVCSGHVHDTCACRLHTCTRFALTSLHLPNAPPSKDRQASAGLSARTFGGSASLCTSGLISVYAVARASATPPKRCSHATLESTQDCECAVPTRPSDASW